MSQPVIVPRAGHTISRKQIDPDALRVLYRLHENNYLAYLVGCRTGRRRQQQYQ